VTDPDAVFSALADGTRRQVMRALAQAGPATATELASEFTVSRQAVVKHLQALGQAGLVAADREGREMRYRLTPAPMAGAMDWMAEVGAGWDDRLASLRKFLADRG
jgi:DNA-binding transcriptional ArsR family regulator